MTIFSAPKALGIFGGGADTGAVGVTPIDVNGDGYLDVIAGYTQAMSGDKAFPLDVLINKGDGTFRYATNKEFAGDLPEIISPFRAAVADFNGDGRNDLFYACYGFDGPVPQLGEVNHLLLSSGKKFTEAPSGYVPTTADVTHGVAWGDIDGDHDVDIYVSNTGVENQYFLLNDGTGKFTRSDDNVPAYYSDITQTSWTSERLADLDGDGDLDMWMGSSVTGIGAHVLRNDGTGHFEVAAVFHPPTAEGGYSIDVDAIDLNHDGLQDILQVTGGSVTAGGVGHVAIFINKGEMNFEDETAQRAFGLRTDLGYGIDTLHYADFNGDGAQDLFVESNYGDFQILLNNGDGVFFKPKDGNIVNRGGSAGLGDFNKDGHPDIIHFIGGGPTEVVLFEWEHKPTYALVGGSANDKLFGDAKGNIMDGAGGKDAIRSGSGADKVQGGAGADKVDGGSGKDTIDGGAGKDKLIGGAAADRFVFSIAAGAANADKILDFGVGSDKIALDQDVFVGLGKVGKLAAAKFYAADGATAAHDKNDRVVYDTATGNLYFDDDGLGGHAAKLFATLSGHPLLEEPELEFLIV